MTSTRWPEDWRCVHVAADQQHVDLLLAADPATRSMTTLNDGDCGLVWGEKRTSFCPSHTTVWCHKYDSAIVFHTLDGLDTLIVATDPNVWSEDQTVHRSTAQRCPHTGPA